jgi:hypothetical protein
MLNHLWDAVTDTAGIDHSIFETRRCRTAGSRYCLPSTERFLPTTRHALAKMMFVGMNSLRVVVRVVLACVFFIDLHTPERCLTSALALGRAKSKLHVYLTQPAKLKTCRLLRWQPFSVLLGKDSVFLLSIAVVDHGDVTKP